MNDADKLANSGNPVYAARDLHDYPYGHGGLDCPFGFAHDATGNPDTVLGRPVATFTPREPAEWTQAQLDEIADALARIVGEQVSEINAPRPAVVLTCGYVSPDFRFACSAPAEDGLAVGIGDELRSACAEHADSYDTARRPDLLAAEALMQAQNRSTRDTIMDAADARDAAFHRWQAERAAVGAPKGTREQFGRTGRVDAAGRTVRS